jgi:O-succinylbenzoic acid--CoA ligase
MADPGHAPLTAVCLPAPAAAAAIGDAWDGERAVLPLDPAAPAAERDRILAALRPTHLLDADGLRPLPGGEAVVAEVAAVVATSGTTGKPKGVELTWTGMRASAGAVSRAVGAGPGDVWLCCLPVHAVGGLSVVARAWTSGLAVEVARPSPAVLAATSGTLVSLVPTVLARCVEAGVALGRFRRILVGGAPLDEAARRRAQAAGASVVATYGLTETWGGVVHEGHPLDGVELRLDADGEILVGGPTVMRGYRLRPEETAAVLSADGWLRTGDVGAWADDGTLRVVDRRRDLVITGGVNVSPTEVEAVLGRHPGVQDVCVAGAPDREWGERVVAHVVPVDPTRPPRLAELRAFAADQLSAPKLPRQLVVVDAIPRTPGGKALRRLLGGRPRLD